MASTTLTWKQSIPFAWLGETIAGWFSRLASRVMRDRGKADRQSTDAGTAPAESESSQDEQDSLAQVIAHLGPLPPIADLSKAEILEASRPDTLVVANADDPSQDEQRAAYEKRAASAVKALCDELTQLTVEESDGIPNPVQDYLSSRSPLESAESMFPSKFGPGSLALHTREALKIGARMKIVQNDRLALDLDECRDIAPLPAGARPVGGDGDGRHAAAAELHRQGQVIGDAFRPQIVKDREVHRAVRRLDAPPNFGSAIVDRPDRALQIERALQNPVLPPRLVCGGFRRDF